MRQENINIIPLQTAATITSSAIFAANLFACSVQASAVGGSSAGTCKLQASNDAPTASNAVPTNWSDIPSATVSVSAAGAFLIPKTEICYQYVRVVYTNTGTGTISVVFKADGD